MNRILFLFAFLALFACQGESTHEQVEQWHRLGIPSYSTIRNAQGELLQHTFYYLNGVRKNTQNMQNGKPHGLEERWSTEGVLQESLEWTHGVAQGSYRTWFRERSLQSSGQMVNGMRHGEFVLYYPDGTLRGKEYYQKGKESGEWVLYHPKSGSIQLKNSCHYDVPMGYLQEFTQKGQMLLQKTCRNGILHGKVQQFYSNGKIRMEGQYSEGLENLQWQWWRADGTLLRTRNFQNGVLHGEQMDFDEFGKPIQTFLFSQGSGEMHRPYSDSLWKSGKLHGWQTLRDTNKGYWHEDLWKEGERFESRSYRLQNPSQKGQQMLQGYWENGKRHGTWLTWYRNGKLRDSLNYQGGELWGPQASFDSTGHCYMRKIHQGKAKPVIVQSLEPHSSQAKP